MECPSYCARYQISTRGIQQGHVVKWADVFPGRWRLRPHHGVETWTILFGAEPSLFIGRLSALQQIYNILPWQLTSY